MTVGVHLFFRYLVSPRFRCRTKCLTKNCLIKVIYTKQYEMEVVEDNFFSFFYFIHILQFNDRFRKLLFVTDISN